MLCLQCNRDLILMTSNDSRLRVYNGTKLECKYKGATIEASPNSAEYKHHFLFYKSERMRENTCITDLYLNLHHGTSFLRNNRTRNARMCDRIVALSKMIILVLTHLIFPVLAGLVCRTQVHAHHDKGGLQSKWEPHCLRK